MKNLFFYVVLFLVPYVVTAQEVSEEDPEEHGKIVMYEGDIIGSDDEISIIIMNDEIVLFSLFDTPISFNILNGEDMSVAGIEGIAYDVERNKATPEVLEFKYFMIYDLSKMDEETKQNFTLGLETDRHYGIDISGEDQNLRFLVDKTTEEEY